MTNERAQELLNNAREATELDLGRLQGVDGGTADDQSDASSDADDLVTHGTDDAVIELLTRRLEAIERAQQRLDAGTYGRSIQSDDPIPDGRLEIEPWAELTVEEQATA
jgi:DnaK suppressor protein